MDPEDARQGHEIQRSITFVLEGLRLVQQQGFVPTPTGRSPWEDDSWQAWQKRAVGMPKSSGP